MEAESLNEPKSPALQQGAVSGSVLCPKCKGDGWTTEHANHPHPDGDCCGACPVQEQCEYCQATGRIDEGELNRRKIIEAENIIVNADDGDLPF